MTFDARKLAHGIHGADCAVHDVLGTSHGWRCERTSEALTAAFKAGRAEGLAMAIAAVQELPYTDIDGIHAVPVAAVIAIIRGAAAQAPSGKAR